MAELSSVAAVAPNGSILFSIPTNFLGEARLSKSPTHFEAPSGKCCRSEEISGEPKMVLLYSIWDLPANIKRELLAER
jgi:hypothetical protein